MDLQDATLDDVEAVVVAKLLEGVGFVSVHLECHAPIVADQRVLTHSSGASQHTTPGSNQRRIDRRATSAGPGGMTAGTRARLMPHQRAPRQELVPAWAMVGRTIH